MQIRSLLQKDAGASRYLEIVTIRDDAIVRTQIEVRHGLVFMRAKLRVI